MSEQEPARQENPKKSKSKRASVKNTPMKNTSEESGKEKKVARRLLPAFSVAEKSPQPGPSAFHVSDSSSDDDVEKDREEDLCCVCKRFQPKELENAVSLVFTQWAQCSICSHWTHLIYCSKVRFVRRDDPFHCPHCTQ